MLSDFLRIYAVIYNESKGYFRRECTRCTRAFWSAAGSLSNSAKKSRDFMVWDADNAGWSLPFTKTSTVVCRAAAILQA